MREEIFRGIPEEKTRHNKLNFKEAVFSLLLSDCKIVFNSGTDHFRR